MRGFLNYCLILVCIIPIHVYSASSMSILGDPGMKHVHIEVEGWNFCNLAGRGAKPAPRYADCWDSGIPGNRVSDADNSLAPPEPIPGQPATEDINKYTNEKEIYLGNQCQIDLPKTWAFWTIMLKNGNLRKWEFECAATNEEPMNQPIVHHNWTDDSGSGCFYGTYDKHIIDPNKIHSEFRSCWRIGERKQVIFTHYLRTGTDYHWLMLYHRADLDNGPTGGMDWNGRGVLVEKPNDPDLQLEVFINVTLCTDPNAMFYLPENGGCWKENGQPCDGDRNTDITRYANFILNPGRAPMCSTQNLAKCPPYHTYLNGTRVYKNDTAHFPYDCYMLWCGPPDDPSVPDDSKCDRYSNPMQQEIMQILACPEWAPHGYPETREESKKYFVGHPTMWKLDIGALRNRLYFTGDGPRDWLSVEIGPEQSLTGGEMEWEMSDFDLRKSQ